MKAGFAHISRFHIRESVELIKDAESWGFDTAWIPDQPLYRDPYVVLAAAAGETRRIRLGVGITNPFTNNPVITARLAGAVAEAADGRFVLGMGSGNKRDFLKPLGHDGSQAPERCRDAVCVIRELLTGGTTHYRSDFFVADGARLSFEVKYPVPLYVAGIAPKILEVAGEVADGSIINLTSVHAMSYALERVRRGQAKSNRPPDAIKEVVAWGYAILTEDKAAAYDRIRPMIAHTVAPIAPVTLHAAGLTDETIHAINETYWKEGPERAAIYVTNDMIDNFAWIGPPEEIADKILALKDLGVQTASIIPWTNQLTEMRGIVRDFAEKVIPRLQ